MSPTSPLSIFFTTCYFSEPGLLWPMLDIAKSTYHFSFFHRLGFVRANLHMKSRSCRDHECLLLHLNLCGILGNAVDGGCILCFYEWPMSWCLSEKKCCVLRILAKALTFPSSFFNICWKNARHWSLLVLELDLSVAACLSKACSILYYIIC